MTKSLYENRDEMRKKLNAGLDEAKKLGENIENAVALGYCFGGSSCKKWKKSKSIYPFSW